MAPVVIADSCRQGFALSGRILASARDLPRPRREPADQTLLSGLFVLIAAVNRRHPESFPPVFQKTGCGGAHKMLRLRRSSSPPKTPTDAFAFRFSNTVR